MYLPGLSTSVCALGVSAFDYIWHAANNQTAAKAVGVLNS